MKACTFHVVHWEAAASGAPDAEAAGAPGQLPQLCKECEGVAEPWRCGLDEVHASVRMLAKEGTGFREEVEDFVCVSPGLAMEYNLRRFHGYNTQRRRKVLTEDTVLGTLLQVHGGGAGSPSPAEAGVGTLALEGGLAGAGTWLRGYAARVRGAAARAGGVAALVVVHPRGAEVNGFGVPCSFFARPGPPILHVVLLVAGLRGFGGNALGRFEEALMDGPLLDGLGAGGCHVGPLRVSVPSSCRSNAALGNLLMCHDRGMLVPLLEDLRCVGGAKYAEWVHQLRSTLLGFGSSSLELERKLQVLDAFTRTRHSERNRRPPLAIEVASNTPTTPAAAEARLCAAVEEGLLPGGKRPWRARQWIEAVEPEMVLSALERLRCDGMPAQWAKLADALEALARAKPPITSKTPRGVRIAASRADEKFRSQGHSVRSVVPQLWQVTCSAAVRLIEELSRRYSEGIDAPDVWLLNGLRRSGVGSDAADVPHDLSALPDGEAGGGEDPPRPKACPKPPSHPPPSWARHRASTACEPLPGNGAAEGSRARATSPQRRSSRRDAERRRPRRSSSRRSSSRRSLSRRSLSRRSRRRSRRRSSSRRPSRRPSRRSSRSRSGRPGARAGARPPWRAEAERRRGAPPAPAPPKPMPARPPGRADAAAGREAGREAGRCAGRRRPEAPPPAPPAPPAPPPPPPREAARAAAHHAARGIEERLAGQER